MVKVRGLGGMGGMYREGEKKGKGGGKRDGRRKKWREGWLLTFILQTL